MTWRHLIPLLRLRFIPVPLLPQYVGLVAATGRLAPVDMPNGLGRWAGAALALILSGFSTYLLNDACDLNDDRENPRRQASPLVRGVIGNPDALRWSVGFRAAALLIAAGIGGLFFLTMAAVSVLSVLYSVSPPRLKARAGWDIAVHAGALAFLYPLGGWTLARPIAEYPWLLSLAAVVYQAGPLLLTLVYDLPSDRASGLRTTAVRLGSDGTVRLCVALMLAGMALFVALAWFRCFISLRFLAYSAPVALLHLAVIGRAWPLRNDPVALRRHVYRNGGAALLPYAVWALYFGGMLPS